MDYEKIEQSEKRRRILGKGVTYLFLTIWALIVLFPFYWMLLTSVKSSRSTFLFSISPLLRRTFSESP